MLETWPRHVQVPLSTPSAAGQSAVDADDEPTAPQAAGDGQAVEAAEAKGASLAPATKVHLRLISKDKQLLLCMQLDG